MGHGNPELWIMKHGIWLAILPLLQGFGIRGSCLLQGSFSGVFLQKDTIYKYWVISIDLRDLYSVIRITESVYSEVLVARVQIL